MMSPSAAVVQESRNLESMNWKKRVDDWALSEAGVESVLPPPSQAPSSCDRTLDLKKNPILSQKWSRMG